MRAQLERHLKNVKYFDNVVIDFMTQKLILTARDEQSLQAGLVEARKVIDKVEPGVTITEKTKKKKISHHEEHEEHCDCGPRPSP